jgi:hypothetical protein
VQPIPASLRVAGGVLLFFGVLSLLEFFLPLPEGVGHDKSGSDLAWSVGMSAFLTVAGGGLLAGVRWAWVVAMMIAIAAVGLPAYEFFRPHDVVTLALGAGTFALILLPGVLLLFALLRPMSIRWFRGAPAQPSAGP